MVIEDKVLRHFPRHSLGGAIEIVDREFEFVRAILPYDYRFTSNADQWNHAQQICEALEGPMSSHGVVRVAGEPVLETKPPFIIYTTTAFRCPYCVRAKTALTEAGYTYLERDVADPAVKAEMLERRPSARTVPQIFLNNGYYIGGCDDLIPMIGTTSLGLLIEANT